MLFLFVDTMGRAHRTNPPPAFASLLLALLGSQLHTTLHVSAQAVNPDTVTGTCAANGGSTLGGILFIGNTSLTIPPSGDSTVVITDDITVTIIPVAPKTTTDTAKPPPSTSPQQSAVATIVSASTSSKKAETKSSSVGPSSSKSGTSSSPSVARANSTSTLSTSAPDYTPAAPIPATIPCSGAALDLEDFCDECADGSGGGGDDDDGCFPGGTAPAPAGDTTPHPCPDSLPDAFPDEFCVSCDGQNTDLTCLPPGVVWVGQNGTGSVGTTSTGGSSSSISKTISHLPTSTSSAGGDCPATPPLCDACDGDLDATTGGGVCGDDDDLAGCPCTLPTFGGSADPTPSADGAALASCASPEVTPLCDTCFGGASNPGTRRVKAKARVRREDDLEDLGTCGFGDMEGCACSLTATDGQVPDASPTPTPTEDPDPDPPERRRRLRRGGRLEQKKKTKRARSRAVLPPLKRGRKPLHRAVRAVKGLSKVKGRAGGQKQGNVRLVQRNRNL